MAIKSHKPSPRYPDGRWEITVRVAHKKKVISLPKPATRHDAQEAELELKKQIRKEIKEGQKTVLDRRSKKHITLNDCLDAYVEEKNPPKTAANCLAIAREYLGHAKLDSDFRRKVEALATILREEPNKKTGKPIKGNTFNQVFAYMRAAINHSYKTYRIEKKPIRAYPAMRGENRVRIWTPEEKDRIFWALKGTGSYLYWPVRFLSVSPMRWRSDGVGLTFTENYDKINEVIYFLADKTENRGKAKKAIYHLWYDDEELRNHILGPHNTDYIFEMIDRHGRWNHTYRNYQPEWDRILKIAEVENFTIHDIKTCAVTHMLDSGYSFLDLENLGIQFDARVIQKHYYNYDGLKVVKSVREKCTNSISNEVKFRPISNVLP